LYGFGTQTTAPGKGYVPNPKTFVCPTTLNDIDATQFDSVNPYGTLDLVKVLRDLKDKAGDKNAKSGHSYEVFGWWHEYDLGDGKFVRKTLQTIQTHPNHNYKPGIIPGPAGIFTIMDRLEPHGKYNENAPNPLDGHGMAGANVVFCDGHGQFIGTSKWTDTYRTSEDDTNGQDGVPK
jgi:prepilin-type processing-associated H-X9-DG protein